MKCFRASVLNGSVSHQAFPFLPEKRKRKYLNPEVLYPPCFTPMQPPYLYIFSMYIIVSVFLMRTALCPLGVLPLVLTFARSVMGDADNFSVSRKSSDFFDDNGHESRIVVDFGMAPFSQHIRLMEHCFVKLLDDEFGTGVKHQEKKPLNLAR